MKAIKNKVSTVVGAGLPPSRPQVPLTWTAEGLSPTITSSNRDDQGTEKLKGQQPKIMTEPVEIQTKYNGRY